MYFYYNMGSKTEIAANLFIQKNKQNSKQIVILENQSGYTDVLMSLEKTFSGY